MTDLQQGWIYCEDGFTWLQRLTAEGLFSAEGLQVDISEVSNVEDLSETWQQYRRDDGWYWGVPAKLVHELAERHGGVVDAQSSYIEWQLPPGTKDAIDPG